MKNEALYNKTVDILVQAYMKDTLVHRDCHACAVGNLIAANMGYSIIRDNENNCSWDNSAQFWDEVFVTIYGLQSLYPHKYTGLAKQQIDSTGYTYLELAKIEKSFESVDRDEDIDIWMFDGLMAVVDALDQIHENTDTVVTEKSKGKFNKTVLA